MRSYSGYLLLEDLFDYLPTDNYTFVNFASNIINPQVKIIEEDCATKLGTVIDVNYEIQGQIELATDVAITKARIDELLSAGTYEVAIRHTHSCISTGGICRKCYVGSYIEKTAPAVGATTIISPRYNYATDVIIGTGLTTEFSLSESPDDYSQVLVIIGGVIQTSGYTIVETNISFSVAPASGSHVVVKFFKVTAQPYIGYLAKTYSGSLLGMASLETDAIMLRPSLVQQSISDSQLNLIQSELHAMFRNITPEYLNYIDRIPDRLEKALYIIALYGIYANVTE